MISKVQKNRRKEKNKFKIFKNKYMKIYSYKKNSIPIQSQKKI